MATAITETTPKKNGPANDFKTGFSGVEQQIEQFTYKTGEKMGAMASDIADQTTAYVTKSRDYVKENPVKSVAIAATAGMVAGVITTLIMQRRH